jgi:hypothetical protein
VCLLRVLTCSFRVYCVFVYSSVVIWESHQASDAIISPQLHNLNQVQVHRHPHPLLAISLGSLF